MTTKRVDILGRKFIVHGDPADRYFRDFVPDGGAFGDAPIVVAARYCAPDAIIADVGANIGLSALAFARTAPQGRVIAVEPSDRNYAFLLANLRDNGLANVEPVHAALSDRAGTLRLLEDSEFMAGSRVQVGTPAEGSTIVDVPATTLDLELTRLGLSRLDF